MDGFVEQALAPALGGLAIAQILFENRNEPRIEDTLATAGRIKAAIEVEIRTFQVQTNLFGYLVWLKISAVLLH
jgi:hypothetical protein